jgi:16S rRNA (uracil1498-N3)-methyltransferase
LFPPVAVNLPAVPVPKVPSSVVYPKASVPGEGNAVGASEQSGRGDIPKIEQPTTLDGLFNTGILPQEKIVFHLEGMSFKDYRNNYNHPSVAAFIGPEGGFSQKEINFFQSYNVKVVTLGSQVLRAETAAIAVASLLLL